MYDREGTMELTMNDDTIILRKIKLMLLAVVSFALGALTAESKWVAWTIFGVLATFWYFRFYLESDNHE